MENKLINTCLIGASTVDYIATSKDRFVLKNKNAGTIKISFGGVMRNVAYSLGLLGDSCYFLSPIGNDLYGIKNKEELESKNIKVISPNVDKHSAIYLCLNDNDNDMICGLTDNSIFEYLNFDFIYKNKNIIEKCDFLVIDGNLDDDSLKKVFENFKDKKIIVEAVSTIKAKKFAPYLANIYLLKCNNYEAKAILNNEDLTSEEILDEFNKRGLKNCIISRGYKDVLYLDNGIKKRGKVNRADEFKNTTGCGDALFAGVIHSLSNYKSFEEGVKLGLKLAYLTLFSDSAVNEEIVKYKKEN